MKPGDNVLVSDFDGDIETIGVKAEFVERCIDDKYLCKSPGGAAIKWRYCEQLLDDEVGKC